MAIHGNPVMLISKFNIGCAGLTAFNDDNCMSINIVLPASYHFEQC